MGGTGAGTSSGYGSTGGRAQGPLWSILHQRAASAGMQRMGIGRGGKERLRHRNVSSSANSSWLVGNRGPPAPSYKVQRRTPGVIQLQVAASVQHRGCSGHFCERKETAAC